MSCITDFIYISLLCFSINGSMIVWNSIRNVREYIDLSTTIQIHLISLSFIFDYICSVTWTTTLFVCISIQKSRSISFTFHSNITKKLSLNHFKFSNLKYCLFFIFIRISDHNSIAERYVDAFSKFVQNA